MGYYAIRHKMTGELLPIKHRLVYTDKIKAKQSFTHYNLPTRYNQQNTWEIIEVRVSPVKREYTNSEEWLTTKIDYETVLSKALEETGATSKDLLAKWLKIAFNEGKSN